MLLAIAIVVPALSYLGPFGTHGAFAWAMYARGIVLELRFVATFSGEPDRVVPNAVLVERSPPAAAGFLASSSETFYPQAHALFATFATLPPRLCPLVPGATRVTAILRSRTLVPGSPIETRTATVQCPRALPRPDGSTP